MIQTENLPNEVASALTDLADHYQDFETMDRRCCPTMPCTRTGTPLRSVPAGEGGRCAKDE